MPGTIGGGGDPSYHLIDGTPFYFHGEPEKSYLYLESGKLRVVDTFAAMSANHPDGRTIISRRRVTIGDVSIDFNLDGQHLVTWPEGQMIVHVVNCELALHNPGYYDPAAPHELIAIPHINFQILKIPENLDEPSGLLIDGNRPGAKDEDYEVPG